MKKLFTIISLFAVFTQTAFAAISPTPTPQVSQIEQQINNLKERIASRVAQLNLVAKKGWIGTVTDIQETQLTLTDLHGNTRIVDVDELTKFSGADSKKTNFGISDITKGATVGVIGLYNKDSRHLLARWVDEFTLPNVYMGGVLSINTNDFTFTIATADVDSVNIDVENITKTTSYTKAGGVVKAGFSKLQVGQRVLVVGAPDIKNKNLIIATRIILFPDLPVNPKIPLIKPDDTNPIPSTGSGKKLTPITH